MVDAANLLTLATSDPIPSSPFAARASLDPSLAERLKEAFLGSAQLHAARNSEGADRAAKTTVRVRIDEAFYDPIREGCQDPGTST